jgi:hypothetical protein
MTGFSSLASSTFIEGSEAQPMRWFRRRYIA